MMDGALLKEIVYKDLIKVKQEDQGEAFIRDEFHIYQN